MIRALSRSLPFALTLLASCNGDKTAGGDDVGGTMVIVQPAEPTSLFPPTEYGSTNGMAVMGAIFDRLAEIGPDLETNGDAGFQPRLATRWDWASDSLSIAFALDPKARWHDGKPLRAEDVRFTFATYTADSVASEARSQLGNIDSVTVRDSLTAVFWFKRRMPQQFLDATYHMHVLPSHLLAGKSTGSLASDAFGRNPVGTGRFRFVRWTPNERIEIIADTGNARGRAKLDRVIWSIAPDFGAATVKLFAGEADFFESMRTADLAQVAQTPTLRLEQILPLVYGYLALNHEKSGAPGTPNPLFADVRVRRALGMGVDKAGIVRNVLDSLGVVTLTAAPRAFIPDTTALKPLKYDPVAARALLDSAGWTDSDGDGVRDKNGVRFSFDILFPSSSANRRNFSVLLQEQFKAIGVEAKPLSLEINAMRARSTSHEFDAYIGSWQMTPGRVGLRQTWASNGESNCCGYKNPAFDALLDSALTTFDGATSRTRWTRLFQLLIDDQPGIWLYEQRVPMAMHRRIRNAPMRADEWWANLADWTIDPAQRIERDRIGLGTAR